MSTYNFSQIKEKVLEWGWGFLNNNASFIEMIKNEKNVLIFELTFQNCLAHVVVNDAFFAPYKHVSFEAITLDSDEAIKSGRPELIYFFYDSEDMSVADVVEELNVGVEYCANYIPNQLEGRYIGKRGNLCFENEKFNKIIHPDDLKKIKQISCREIFVCTDVQFQYLVVNNAFGSVRILPRVFKMCV